jgi:hypothetical protein
MKTFVFATPLPTSPHKGEVPVGGCGKSLPQARIYALPTRVALSRARVPALVGRVGEGVFSRC